MSSYQSVPSQRDLPIVRKNAKFSRRAASHRVRQPFAGLDPLEVRTLLSVVIAPTGKSATYTDVDGDAVTVAISVGTLTPANFTALPTGIVSDEQLELIDLTTGGSFAGTNLTITVKRGPSGDGLVNIGYINATSIDLGTVSIAGDLGRIAAGDGSAVTPAIKLLSVRTLGRDGLASQAPGGSLASIINGSLASLVVKGDVQDSFIGVGMNIGSVAIGGSLIGGSADHSGEIGVTGNIGTVKIAGDLQGSGGLNSGAILASGTIASATIGGSFLGSVGNNSGSLIAIGSIGTVKVAGDVRGRSGSFSGSIASSGGNVTSVTIGGSLIGSSGTDSGDITVHGNLGAVKITGDIVGATGDLSGSVEIGSALTSLAIGGSLSGNSGNESGQIASGGSLGSIKIALNIHGGSGTGSGLIESGTGAITAISVGGSILGGSASQTGEILSGSNLGVVTVGGSLIGSGITGTSSLDQTGCIIATSRITSVTIGGSVVSGGNLGSGALTNTGTIRAGDDIGSLAVKGSLIGNVNTANSSPVIISAAGSPIETSTDLAIGKITIGQRVENADIFAGYSTALAGVNADAQIGSVSVGGDWVASNLVAGASNSSGNVNFGDANDAKLTGAGVNDLPGVFSKIGSVSIKGFVYGSPLVTNGPTNFGFVAESIGSFQFGGITIPPHAAPNLVLLQPTNNVAIDEIV